MLAFQAVKLIFFNSPIYQQSGGFQKNTAIAGVVYKDGLQLNTKNGYFTVSTLHIGNVQEITYFRGAEDAGIESVFTRVLVVFLTAPFSFQTTVHSDKIAQVFLISKRLLSIKWTGKIASKRIENGGGRGLLTSLSIIEFSD